MGTRTEEKQHANGALAARTSWRGSLRDGPYEAWSADGALEVEGCFRAGAAHGAWCRYFANGNPRESMTCVEGLRHGAYRQWNSAGQLLVSGAYERGHPVGLWRAYSDLGELLWEAPLGQQARPSTQARESASRSSG